MYSLIYQLFVKDVLREYILLTGMPLDALYNFLIYSKFLNISRVIFYYALDMKYSTEQSLR